MRKTLHAFCGVALTRSHALTRLCPCVVPIDVEATVEVLSQTAVSYDGDAGTALPAECALLTPPLLQRQASLVTPRMPRQHVHACALRVLLR
jgi:hypothetical protein